MQVSRIDLINETDTQRLLKGLEYLKTSKNMDCRAGLQKPVSAIMRAVIYGLVIFV